MPSTVRQNLYLNVGIGSGPTLAFYAWHKPPGLLFPYLNTFHNPIYYTL